MPIPIPTAPAPELDVPLVSGGRLRLADQHPDRFTMVVFYRGLHCPVSRGYLNQLDRAAGDFRAAGVTSIAAISGDDADRAQRSVTEWGLQNLPVGYGHSVDSMREWGVFVSKGIKNPNPPCSVSPVYSCCVRTPPSTWQR